MNTGISGKVFYICHITLRIGKSVTHVSLNVRGLGHSYKRADTLSYLKSRNYSIYCLQETHFTDSDEKYIRAKWGCECFFNNFSSQSKAVAILFNSYFEFKVHKIITDETYEGMKLI